MGWATDHIEKLRKGESVKFRPRGRSMEPKIKSGQLCTVEPLVGEPVKGDIVLCRVRNSEYLHIVHDIEVRNPNDLRSDEVITLFHIGNNRGGRNGWIHGEAIFGKLVSVE